MKKLVLATVLAGLSSCGVVPIQRTVLLNVVGVDLPATLAPGEDLTVTVKYRVACNDTNQRLLLVRRTPQALVLKAVATNEGLNVPCTTEYLEKTLTYVDSGSVNRANPFEIMVNGRSWGKVEVK